RLVRRGVAAPSAIAAIGAIAAPPARASVPTALGEVTVRAAADILMGRALAVSTSVRVATLVEATARGGMGIGAKVAVVTFVAVLGVAIVGRFSSPPPSAPQAPAAPREAIRREMLRLKGTWTTEADVQETVNGVPAPPRKVKVTWSIDRDTITQSTEEFAEWTYRYSLNPDQAPGTIDLQLLNLSIDLKGLYKLDGDTLTLCYGEERPKDLASPANPEAGMRLVLHRSSRTPTEVSPRFPNAEGCYWAVAPNEHGVPGSFASGRINVIIDEPKDGSLRVNIASMARLVAGNPDAEYRPVAFGADKKRYAFKLTGGGGWSTSAPFRDVVLGHGEFRLDPAVLPARQVKALGIEVITPEGKRAARKAASKTAMQEARNSRIDVLPWPEVGQPYEFLLKDSRGRVLRSADLKGKVVLIDCWAGWCSACMTKMPGLKELDQRRHNDGLEIIGVNFDRHPARTDELVRRLGLPWPEIYVSADDHTYSLWQDASGIHDLPRLLLIDRQGILRWDGPPAELEKQVEAMLRK
ncbi:MAG: thioredoxin-like domain-containing protein, partial [Isosphaeraceae bacterium]